MAPAPLKRKMSFATVERYEELDCLKDIYSETPNDEVLEQELRQPLLYKCSALAKFLVSKNPITLLDAPVVLRAIEAQWPIFREKAHSQFLERVIVQISTALCKRREPQPLTIHDLFPFLVAIIAVTQQKKSIDEIDWDSHVRTLLLIAFTMVNEVKQPLGVSPWQPWCQSSPDWAESLIIFARHAAVFYEENHEFLCAFRTFDFRSYDMPDLRVWLSGGLTAAKVYKCRSYKDAKDFYFPMPPSVLDRYREGIESMWEKTHAEILYAQNRDAPEPINEDDNNGKTSKGENGKTSSDENGTIL
ncbi:hypothetical protein CGCS363_v000107 [Colletotrichum siamense]|uniref:uncharacterized protein n=1 Tax=Colletotrichum siamense TaxID=690259 RepID=UPI0018729531|nr:uncharacterized protein CGCS363_v000107 [Colletotrichum siamense]KAF5515270.1 hypothetical protein CGCS363_v000107 [Colletotrichum siamense]